MAHRVPEFGPHAIAIAVYANHDGEMLAAQESGFEGVACVDDAARALQLYAALWTATSLPWAAMWCRGLLEFILRMEDGNGLWRNFIYDWGGDVNLTGRTSIAGGHFWQARAMRALVAASAVLEDPRIELALQRGLPHLSEAAVPSDVRAIHVALGCDLVHRGSPDAPSLTLLSKWADEIAGCQQDGILKNSQQEAGTPHLWGHIQEGVLAEAATILDRDDLLRLARNSADLLYPDLVDSGFDVPHIEPYGVASTIYSLDRLAATGDDEFSALATIARAWFDGRNPAGVAVYDRVTGRVSDGIDKRILNPASGAEANIEAASALFAEMSAAASKIAEAAVLPQGANSA